MLVRFPRLYFLGLGAQVLKHPAAWETVLRECVDRAVAFVRAPANALDDFVFCFDLDAARSHLPSRRAEIGLQFWIRRQGKLLVSPRIERLAHSPPPLRAPVHETELTALVPLDARLGGVHRHHRGTERAPQAVERT